MPELDNIRIVEELFEALNVQDLGQGNKYQYGRDAGATGSSAGHVGPTAGDSADDFRAAV